MENYYEYINEESIEKNCMCNICQKPLIEPVTTACGKIFCRLCVEQKPEYSKNELTPVTDSSIVEVLNKIFVKCKLCDEKDIERHQFENHMTKICVKAIVTCPAIENNCPWIGLREELSIHLGMCSYEPQITNSQKEKHGELLPFQTIHLHKRHFHNQDIAIAVKALIINKRCTSLDLFNRGITANGASLIASVLENDTLIETLSFRNNLICDSGVQFLAKALAKNSYLKRLDLNDNSITDTGVRLLVEMLKTNNTLIKLTLSFNRITNEGMEMLMDVLVNYNSTLQCLSVTANPAINDSSMHAILNLIRHNQGLRILNIEGCGFSWWNKKQITLHRTIHPKSNLDILL